MSTHPLRTAHSWQALSSQAGKHLNRPGKSHSCSGTRVPTRTLPEQLSQCGSIRVIPAIPASTNPPQGTASQKTGNSAGVTHPN